MTRTSGDENKLANTEHSPAARLLDITRLISRAGRLPTGVDRVEQAYLRHFLTEPNQLFGLARTTLGYVLLDRSGMERLAARSIDGADWGHADRLSWTARKKGPFVRRAESDLRRWALARCLPSRLGKMLRAHFPQGADYFNIGHSNLTDRTLWAIKRDIRARVVVMIHDTIPLDYPEFQRPGTPAVFRAKLKRVQRFADLILYNSAHSQERAETHMAQWGPAPVGVVAPLGLDLAAPAPQALPPQAQVTGPYFVTVGTIEPRKNHALLLDVWDDLAADPSVDPKPLLLICGARGWNNDAVFARLDGLQPDGLVRELTGLEDGALSALIQNARALVFPSHAEGYGLPPIEATALGTPVICLDLPVYWETLGDIPVYLKETDRYLLGNIVRSLTHKGTTEQSRPNLGEYDPPTWDTHFRLVLQSL